MGWGRSPAPLPATAGAGGVALVVGEDGGGSSASPASAMPDVEVGDCGGVEGRVLWVWALALRDRESRGGPPASGTAASSESPPPSLPPLAAVAAAVVVVVAAVVVVVLLWRSPRSLVSWAGACAGVACAAMRTGDTAGTARPCGPPRRAFLDRDACGLLPARPFPFFDPDRAGARWLPAGGRGGGRCATGAAAGTPCPAASAAPVPSTGAAPAPALASCEADPAPAPAVAAAGSAARGFRVAGMPAPPTNGWRIISAAVGRSRGSSRNIRVSRSATTANSHARSHAPGATPKGEGSPPNASAGT